MALILSTAFREGILGRSSFDDLMNYGSIRIFSGPQPATADAAEQGTLLGVVTAGGGAWSAGSPDNGLIYTRNGLYLVNDATQQWLFTALASGTAGWFRVVGNAADTGGNDITACRIDGAIGGTSDGKEMQWDSTTLSAGQLYSLDSFLFTLPPIA